MLLKVCNLGVSENKGTLFGGPFKGMLFYLGYSRGRGTVPLFFEMPISKVYMRA